MQPSIILNMDSLMAASTTCTHHPLQVNSTAQHSTAQHSAAQHSTAGLKPTQARHAAAWHDRAPHRSASPAWHSTVRSVSCSMHAWLAAFVHHRAQNLFGSIMHKGLWESNQKYRAHSPCHYIADVFPLHRTIVPPHMQRNGLPLKRAYRVMPQYL